MTLLVYQEIKERPGIITPMHERTVHEETGTSYGLGSCGYDIRVRESLQLWSGAFVLASSIEHFDLPDDICGIVCDKSTWVRCGITVQNTRLEPGWRGYLTLEIGRHGHLGGDLVLLPAGSPIAQVQFEQLNQPTLKPYRGKYQDQAPHPVEAIKERP